MWLNRNASSPANAGAVRPDELLAQQRLQVRTDPRALVLGRELGHGAPPEDLADDRGALDHRALLDSSWSSRADEQRVDRAGDGDAREVAVRGPVPVVPREQSVVDQLRSISSTNSGLPSAASVIRDADVAGEPPRPRRFSIRRCSRPR